MCYNNLSMLEVMPEDDRANMADLASNLLSSMEEGSVEYDRATWMAAEEYLQDCRTWAMRKAEVLGVTNKCSKAFGLM